MVAAIVALTSAVLTIPTNGAIARGQGTADPPIGVFGNPHDFRPGPPIPSCNADFNQEPPDDPIKGCRETP